MRNFFQEIKKSIYHPLYYQSLLHRPFRSSFFYYAKLVLLLSLAASALVSLLLFPLLISGLEQTATDLLASYPDQLVVSVVAGQVAVNLPEPVLFALPREGQIFDHLRRVADVERLLVIDTRHPFTPEQFRAYRTLVLVTKNLVATRDTDQSSAESIKVSPLSPTLNQTIEKSELITFYEKIRRSLPWVSPLAILAVYLVVTLAFFSILIWLFLSALLLYITFWLSGRDIGFWKSYQLSLHGVTAVFLADIVLLLTPLHSLGFFPAVAITALLVWVNLLPQQMVAAER